MGNHNTAAAALDAKRLAFYPLREDIDRIHKFSDMLAREYGLHVHPNLRDVIHFILDLAEFGVAARQLNSRLPPAERFERPIRRKHRKKAA